MNMSKTVVPITLLAVTMLICACAQESKMIWLRADGKRGATDPVLVRQFEADRKACTQRGADRINETCMTQRGYVLVREDEAEAKRVELAEAEKVRRDGAAKVATPSEPNR
jgi:hypothetical protein